MKSALIVLAIMALNLVALSQTTSPLPTPTPFDDESVVKISTDLIQLDVTVTDRKGNPVAGLTPADFTVIENGKPQKISDLSYVTAVREGRADVRRDGVETVLPTPSAPMRPEQVRRTIALVVDDLSMSFTSVYQARRALKRYVDVQMADGDLVAIIRTGGGVGALQQFTSDKRLLYAAIEKVKWNPLGSGGVTVFAPYDPDYIGGGPDGPSEEDIEEAENREQDLTEERSSVFVSGTLGSLRYIVEGMGTLPGRKSVILFSDGFRLMPPMQNGRIQVSRVGDYLRQLIDIANRSSVVFYTIDPRGLVYTGPTAADRVGSDPRLAQRLTSGRTDTILSTQSGMRFLAVETGGFAVVNNNDIIGGVERVLNDQSYYLLAYEPDSNTFDPRVSRFNHLEVKVNRKDLVVRYRSGFFNRTDEAMAARSNTANSEQQIVSALTSPFSVNDISLSFNPLFGSDAKQGMFVRSLLHVKGSDLKFIDRDDGRKAANFTLLAASFGDNGTVVDQFGKVYQIIFDDEQMDQVMRGGFVYDFVFPVKKAGGYQFRVALRDNNAGTVGSASQYIEIPDLKKKRLTLSSLVVEGFTTDEWTQLATGADLSSRLKADSSLRQFKPGRVLRFGMMIYNARLDSNRNPNLVTKVRLIRDGKVEMDGKEVPLVIQPGSDLASIPYMGAITLSPNAPAGDYILQLIVTGKLAKQKHSVVTQNVQFEVLAP